MNACVPTWSDVDACADGGSQRMYVRFGSWLDALADFDAAVFRLSSRWAMSTEQCTPARSCGVCPLSTRPILLAARRCASTPKLACSWSIPRSCCPRQKHWHGPRQSRRRAACMLAACTQVGELGIVHMVGAGMGAGKGTAGCSCPYLPCTVSCAFRSLPCMGVPAGACGL